jgi:hypothetical protein
VPRLCEFYPGIFLTTEEKARKNLSQCKKNLSQSTVYILPKHPHIHIHTHTHYKTISWGKRDYGTPSEQTTRIAPSPATPYFHENTEICKNSRLISQCNHGFTNISRTKHGNTYYLYQAHANECIKLHHIVPEEGEDNALCCINSLNYI